jgi:hypothetical protein
MLFPARILAVKTNQVMNKPFLKFSALFLAGAMLVACGSDDDVAKPIDDEDPDTEVPTEDPTEYADLTVEENKAKLQDNSIEFANSVETLKNSSGIETTIAFSTFLENAGVPLNEGRKSSLPIFDLVNNLKDFASGKSIDNTIAGLRTAEEVTSIQDEFNNSAGTYTYNRPEQIWVYTESPTDKIVFKFPSKEEGSTNNATYTVYGYTGKNVSNSAVEGYEGEYPTGLKIDLEIDGQKKLEYVLAAGYNDKGEPTSLTLSVKVDAFVLAYEVTQDGKKAAVRYSLKENDKKLYELGVDSDGTFNTGTIEDANTGEEVFDKGTVYFQMLNIKFSGHIDVDALAAALDKANTPEQTAAAWNDNMKMIVFYVDSNKKIADGKVILIEETDDWGNEDTYIDLQLIFANDTKMSVETFAETGFDKLTKKIEDIFGE